MRAAALHFVVLMHLVDVSVLSVPSRPYELKLTGRECVLEHLVHIHSPAASQRQRYLRLSSSHAKHGRVWCKISAEVEIQMVEICRIIC